MNPLKTISKESSLTYPYPIAVSLKHYSDQEYSDHLKEWEALSTVVLHSLLMYLSHLLLSDLVSTGKQPAHLYHRIQSILSRPLMGHYAGFLRETARYYRQENIASSMPELIGFLLRSEIDCKVTEGGKPLIGELVDYRNLLAHGRIDNDRVMDEVVERVRYLAGLLIKETGFLTKYPLQTDDGTSMMGWSLPKMEKNVQPLLKVTEGNLVVRPLLLKMKDNDLMLLEDFDIRGKKLSYRGSVSYSQLKKKDVEKGDGKDLFESLKELLRKVRAEDALLDQADWESFRERSMVLTQRTLDLYSEMGKFRPDFYVPRRDWEGDESIYKKFLASDRTLLAVSGVQGTGKSALAAHIASRSIEEGHAVLFVNAQRFTFADVEWSGTPYPKFFSDLLHYTCPFDKAAISRIIKTGEDKGKKVLLFIDAVNEVDGLTKKWNRFIAMELLLNWISDISQPGLKVIVTFRLDVYEDFDYLQESDEFIPKDLNEISYPGNHERKGWVWEIEPFNEEQARELFKKLREKPELGMAPDMTWNQIKEGLGEKLIPVIDNPLIFQIFLRAHHGEKVIVEKGRDAIMMRYAEKLTGAYEAAGSPWWIKVWRFLKNGNITAKEQILSEILDKTAEGGGAAFIVENLDLRIKRDQLLFNKIGNPKENALLELKQAGLLIEEKINDIKYIEQLSYRRITFVNELFSYTLDGINSKISRINNFWFSLKYSFLLVIGMLFLIYGALVIYIFLGAPETYKLINDDWHKFLIKALLSPVLIWFINFYFMAGVINNFYQTSSGSRSIGVFNTAVYNSIVRKSNSALYKYLPYMVLFLAIISVVAIKYKFIYWILVPTVLYLGTPYGLLQVFRLGGAHFSPKVILISFKKHMEYCRSKAFLKPRKYFFLMIPISIMSYFYCINIKAISPATNFPENSHFPLPRPEIIKIFIEEFKKDQIYIVILLICSAIFFAFFPYFQKYLTARQFDILKKKRISLKDN